MKGFAPPSRFGGAQVPPEPVPITRTITVTEGISVKDLAEKLGVRGKDLIATLLMRGVFVTVNQSLDARAGQGCGPPVRRRHRRSSPSRTRWRTKPSRTCSRRRTPTSSK